MKKSVITIFSTLLLLIIACSGGHESDVLGLFDTPSRSLSLPGNDLIEAERMPVSMQESDDPVPLSPSPRKIIKSGNMEIRSDDVHKSREGLGSLVEEYDAYISSESFHETSSRYNYNLTIRIAAEEFDRFVESIDRGGDVIVSKEINASDVTDQYYDLASRLENNKAVEKRYRELLNRATTISDILEIERQLGQVRGEIESQQGRLNRMDSQIAYSTLHVRLFQEKSMRDSARVKESFSERIVKALGGGWNGLLLLIIALLNIWPLWIIGGVVWFAVVRITRKKSSNK